MEADELRETVFNELARIGQALSDPTRLRLLDVLTRGEATVSELAEATDLSSANASQHLQKLHESGLISRKKEGLNVCYRLADEDVHEFYRNFQNLGEARLSDIRQVMREFLRERESLEQINLNELQEHREQEDVLLLDVRPREEYEAEHLPEARSIPLDDLEEHLDELPEEKELIVYCRGPYCVLSVEAVEKLREHGFEAKRLKEGIQLSPVEERSES